LGQRSGDALTRSRRYLVWKPPARRRWRGGLGRWLDQGILWQIGVRWRPARGAGCERRRALRARRWRRRRRLGRL